MNISTPTPAVFDLPDKASMDTARQLIHTQVASLSLEFLPVIKEKLPSLKTALNVADTQCLNKLAAITAQLNTAGLANIDQKQQQVEADTRLSNEQKEQALGMLNAQRAREVSALTAVVRSGAQAIAQSTDDLQQIKLQPTNSSIHEALQRQLDTLTQQSADKEDKMSTIAEDRRLLDETIKTYEQHKLVDIFKETLPSTEELSALAMPSPHLMALQVGIVRLQKLLGKISSALTYSDLVDERDKLRNRYNSLMAESRSAQKEAKAIARNLEELATLASLDNNRMIWVQQSKKLSESLYHFVNNGLTQTDDPAAISLHVSQLSAYIKSLYSVTRTV